MSPPVEQGLHPIRNEQTEQDDQSSCKLIADVPQGSLNLTAQTVILVVYAAAPDHHQH